MKKLITIFFLILTTGVFAQHYSMDTVIVAGTPTTVTPDSATVEATVSVSIINAPEGKFKGQFKFTFTISLWDNRAEVNAKAAQLAPAELAKHFPDNPTGKLEFLISGVNPNYTPQFKNDSVFGTAQVVIYIKNVPEGKCEQIDNITVGDTDDTAFKTILMKLPTEAVAYKNKTYQNIN